MKTLVFELNKNSSFLLVLSDSIKEINCFSTAEIYFCKGSERFIVACDSLQFLLDCFWGALKKILEKKFYLPASLNRDLGYFFNEYRLSKQKKPRWDGYDYLIWGYKNTVFLYNNGDSITFEIAPLFPTKSMLSFHSEDLSDEELKILTQYEEWKKQYKTIAKETVSREVAEALFKKSGEVLGILRSNSLQLVQGDKKI